MNASSKHTPFVSALLVLTIPLVWPLNALSSAPSDAELQNAVDKAYAAFKDVTEGANADYIPRSWHPGHARDQTDCR